jgi:hypothetical protein
VYKSAVVKNYKMLWWICTYFTVRRMQQINSTYSSVNSGTFSAATTTTGNFDAPPIVVTFVKCWGIVASAVAIVLNIIVLVTFVRTKSLLPPTARVLMIHQSALELTCSAFAIIYRQTSNQNFTLSADLWGNIVCIAWNAFYWIANYCVLWNSVHITLDRYFAICHPLKHFLSPKSVTVLVLANDVIIAAATYGAIFQNNGVVPETGICQVIVRWKIFRLIWGTLNLIFIQMPPLLAAIIFYPQMIATIYASRRKFATNSQQSSNTTQNAASIRLVRTCLAATAILILCVIPYVVSFNILIAIMAVQTGGIKSFVNEIEVLAASFYPLLSPIIYSLSAKRFQSAIPAAFGRR